MKLVYFTYTQNCERFKNRIAKHFTSVEKIKTEITQQEEDFILLTPTIGFGEIPQFVETYLDRQVHLKEYFKGVIASGHRNWGDKFAKAGDLIAEKYDVPVILKVEQSGDEFTTEFLDGLFGKINYKK